MAEPAPSPPLERRELPLLPPEIVRFFEDRSPRTLTVRGAPGTGKTTFALSALVAFEGQRVYVSSAVSKETLLRQYPWVASSGGPEVEFVEFLRFRTPSKDAQVSVDQMREVLQARAADLVDLSSVLSLPPSLYRTLEREPGRPKMVVFDSWEGWVENLLGGTSADLDVWSTRWVLERSLLDQLLRTGTHVVMVAERDDRSRFDYVVDGALALSADESEGRQERWMTLSKLRGIRIGSPSYPFTLEGGRFRCIVPRTSRALGRTLRADPDPGPSEPSLWPGSTAFATRFGRLPARGTLLLETDGETPLGVSWLLAAPMVLSTLRSEGKVVLRPPAGFAADELYRQLDGAAPTGRVTEGLRFLDVAPGPDRAGVAPELFLPSADSLGAPESVRRAAAIDFLRQGTRPNQPDLVVVFPHSDFDPGPEPQPPDPYLGLPSAARRAGAFLSAVVVLRNDDPHVAQARVRSSVHLVAHARRGQFFLYGVRPWTPLFVLELGGSEAARASPFDLVPVV